MSNEQWCASLGGNNSITIPPELRPGDSLEGFYKEFCRLGWRPHLVTGLILDILRQHFAMDKLTTAPWAAALRHLIWREELQKQSILSRPILIESITRWRPEAAEMRPALIVKRQSFRTQKLGISSGKSGQTPEGDELFTSAWIGSHTIFCITPKGMETEILAFEVARHLTDFAPILIRNLDLKKFEVLEIGPSFEIEESRESQAVPVNVATVFVQTWKVAMEAPALREFKINISSLF